MAFPVADSVTRTGCSDADGGPVAPPATVYTRDRLPNLVPGGPGDAGTRMRPRIEWTASGAGQQTTISDAQEGCTRSAVDDLPGDTSDPGAGNHEHCSRCAPGTQGRQIGSVAHQARPCPTRIPDDLGLQCTEPVTFTAAARIPLGRGAPRRSGGGQRCPGHRRRALRRPSCPGSRCPARSPFWDPGCRRRWVVRPFPPARPHSETDPMQFACDGMSVLIHHRLPSGEPGPSRQQGAQATGKSPGNCRCGIRAPGAGTPS